MIIDIPTFSGVSFRLDPDKLQGNQAQRAINCNFNNGTVVGLRGPTAHAAGLIPKYGFVYRDADSFKAYGWTYDADAVRSPTQKDIYKRYYWTGNTGTATEYRFARSLEGVGHVGPVGQSYKVGVINSALWDNTLKQLGIDVSTQQRTAPPELSAISKSVFEVWIADSSGKLNQKVTGFTANWINLNAATGWGDALTITLPKTITDYGKVAVPGDATYRGVDAKVAVLGQTYSAKLWYKGSATAISYVQLVGTTPTGTLTVGALTTVSTIDENGGVTGSGQFNTRSNTVFSTDGTDLPNEISTYTAPATPETLKLAAVWSFDYQGQQYKGTFHEDKSLSTTLDFAGGVGASLTRDATNTIFTLTPQWGTDQPTEVRNYIMTFVNQCAEESEPSTPLSAPGLLLNPGREVAVFKVNTTTFNSAVASLNLSADRYPLHGVRLYRTATSSTGDTEFLYVATIKFNAGGDNLPGDIYVTPTINGITHNYLDNIPASGLGSACPTQELIADASELQKLQGLTAIHNNMLAAFKDNEVWIMEPSQPWAVRANAIYPLPHKVIQLLAVEQGFIAFTEGSPHYFTGALPEQMQPQRIPTELPLVNKRAACSVGGMVYYISSDGPMVINGMNVTPDPNFSREKFREEYRGMRTNSALFGAGMNLVSFGNRLVCYTPGATRETKGWIYDIEDQAWIETTERVDFAMNIPANTFGLVHDNVAYANGSTNWYVLSDDDSPSSWTWHSRDYVMPKPTNFACGQIRGSGTATLSVYADGALFYQTQKEWVNGSSEEYVFRLPSGRLANKWSFKIVAEENSVLRQFTVANTMEELRSV
jgi:hypothetical protein